VTLSFPKPQLEECGISVSAGPALGVSLASLEGRQTHAKPRQSWASTRWDPFPNSQRANATRRVVTPQSPDLDEGALDRVEFK